MRETLNIKQITVLVVGIFLLTALALGGTYAWLQHWTLMNNVINSKTTCLSITYTKNGELSGTLFPSSSRNGGLHSTVTFGLKSSCKNIEVSGNMDFNIASGTDILFQTVSAHCEDSQTLKTLKEYTSKSTCESQSGAVWVTNGTALKYEVYAAVAGTDENELIKKGYINQTGVIELRDNFSLSEADTSLAPKTYNYNIYVWLDGYLSDNTYQGQTFNATINADASQVIE